MVRNYTETVVENALRSELAGNPDKYAGMCQCQSCRAYIMSVALNELKPFYVTGKKGEIFGEYKNKVGQNQSDVFVALAHGIEALVRLDPHSTE